jgi:DNA polymerase I
MESRGIRPEQIPDWLALVGDPADGIPGLPGFGAKAATNLLSAFATLEHISSPFPSTIRGRERLESVFRAQREDALLYKRLATLRFDVPLRESLSDLLYGGEDTAALRSLSRRFGRAADYLSGSAQQRKPVE